MKKIFSIFIFVMLIGFSSFIFADDVTSGLNSSRNYYGYGMYHTALLKGVTALDLMFQGLMTNMEPLIPVLDGFGVMETNTLYYFSGQNGYIDVYFEMEKVITNDGTIMSIKLDNSIMTLEMFNNLMLGYEYLNDTGRYLMTNFSSYVTSYECIIEDDYTIYFPFTYTETNDLAETGLVIEVNFDYTKSYSASKKIQKRNSYLEEMLRKLKTASLLYYLQ